jgi:hypothetical protein
MVVFVGGEQLARDGRGVLPDSAQRVNNGDIEPSARIGLVEELWLDGA